MVGGVIAAGIKLTESVLVTQMQNQSADKRTLAQRIDELRDEMILIRKGQKIVMHDRLTYLSRTYLEKDFVSHENRRNLLSMHESYHNDLGGNGDLDDLIMQVKKLPIK